MNQHIASSQTKAFPLNSDELEWLQQIRQQLASTKTGQESATAQKATQLCKILGELPLAPKECHLEAIFDRRHGHEHDFIRLEITSESIRLAEGGYQYDATVGGSSWSKTLFAADIDGTRQTEIAELGAWLECSFSFPFDSIDIHDHLS